MLVDAVGARRRGSRREASLHPALTLINFDGDRKADPEVKFDRASLAGLLDRVLGPRARVRATWQDTGGSDGTASAEIRSR